jgi:hypothetical protein
MNRDPVKGKTGEPLAIICKYLKRQGLIRPAISLQKAKEAENRRRGGRCSDQTEAVHHISCLEN